MFLLLINVLGVASFILLSVICLRKKYIFLTVVNIAFTLLFIRSCDTNYRQWYLQQQEIDNNAIQQRGIS